MSINVKFSLGRRATPTHKHDDGGDGGTEITPDRISMQGAAKIENLAAPSNDNDAARKTYVDAVEQGLDIKDSVVAATDGSNIDLTSATDPNPIDGVTLSDGDRVLLKDQSTASENGIYNAQTATDPTTWTRTADADEDDEVNAGMYMFVEEGSANANRGFVLTTKDPITVDTTALSFTQFSGAGQLTAGSGISKSGDTLSLDESYSATWTSATTYQADLRVDDGSGLVVGSTSKVSVSAAEGEFQMLGTGNADTRPIFGAWRSDNGAPQIRMLHSRATTIGNNAALQNDDRTGRISFRADDGTDYASESAAITARIDGAVSQDDVPGRIELRTARDGANSPTEALRVNSSQQALATDGSAGTPAIGFINDTDTGIHRSGADSINVGAGGSSQLAIGTSTVNVQANNITQVGATADAAAGQVRMGNNTGIYSRNSADSADYRLIGTAGSDDLVKLGNTNEAGVALARRGSETSPALVFESDTDVGVYSSGTDTINFATNGGERVRIGTTYVSVRGQHLIGVGSQTDASQGDLRMGSATNLEHRNGADDADIGTLATDASDNVYLGFRGTYNQIRLGDSTGGVVQTRNTFDLQGNVAVNIGSTTAATAGALRMGSGNQLTARNDADSADIRLLRTDGSDNIVTGNTTASAFEMRNVVTTFKPGNNTVASAGAARFEAGAALKARNNANDADITLIETNNDFVRVGSNSDNILMQNNVLFRGNRLQEIGGSTDAGTGSARFTNNTAIRARNNADDGDFGIVFTDTDDIQLENRVLVGENSNGSTVRMFGTGTNSFSEISGPFSAGVLLLTRTNNSSPADAELVFEDANGDRPSLIGSGGELVGEDSAGNTTTLT